MTGNFQTIDRLQAVSDTWIVDVQLDSRVIVSGSVGMAAGKPSVQGLPVPAVIFGGFVYEKS